MPWRMTVPANSLLLLTEIPDTSEDPLRICHPYERPWLESIEKFGAVPGIMLYLIVMLCDKVPSVAVMMTV